MLFFSDSFLFIFLPAVVIVFYALSRRRSGPLQKLLLLGASVFFYGFWSLPHVPLLLGASLIGLLAIRWIERRARKHLMPGVFPLLFGVVGSLGLLMVFKYASFWMDVFYLLSGVDFFRQVGKDAESVVLPLGVSFYTLQGTAAVIDRWRAARKGEITQNTPALDFFTFMTFFPQLIAGPIVRYGQMMPQLEHIGSGGRNENAARGLTIFAVGLAKKVLIADYLAPVAGALFDSSASPTMADAFLGSVAYTLQLYFDFSGYSDMAIGLGAMFGLAIPVNFLSPYKSASFTEFWRKWHVTLSFWFRDYLYIPLGGSRCGGFRRVMNVLAVTGVAGLWHGASWTFILWGIYQGVFVLLHRLWKRVTRLLNMPSLPRVPAVGLNFILLVLGWVLFRATSFDRAVDVYKGLAGFDGGLELLAGFDLYNWLLMGAGMIIILLLPNIHHVEIRPGRRWAVITGILLAASISGLMAYSPFIYFQF